jgi:limonene 1,2-monooxygenase
VIQLLRGETVTRKTDWFDLRNARLQLPCYTQPTIEMAVAAARSPVGSQAAGKYGIGMLSIGGTSPDAMARHTANWGLYEEQARSHGHKPDRRNWRVVGMFHIADTREQARKNVEFGLDAFRKYFHDVATFPIVPPDITDVYNFMIESGTACIGTPDDAIAYIERLIKGSGGFGGIMELAHNWADWPAMQRHYELMARFVHPHFQKSRDLMHASYDYAVSNRDAFVGQAGAAVQTEIDKLAAKRAAASKGAAD